MPPPPSIKIVIGIVIALILAANAYAIMSPEPWGAENPRHPMSWRQP